MVNYSDYFTVKYVVRRVIKPSEFFACEYFVLILSLPQLNGVFKLNYIRLGYNKSAPHPGIACSVPVRPNCLLILKPVLMCDFVLKHN